MERSRYGILNLTTKAKTMNEITTKLSDRGIDPAIWSAIRSSIFPGATEESCLLAWEYCKARGLDILKKPCHIVPMSVRDATTGKHEWRDVIMPSIAEQRITASRTGQYEGQSAAEFGPMVEMTFGKETFTVPEYCTVTVYRTGKNGPVSYPHTEFFDEAAGVTKDGTLNSMWRRRKRGQLAKCAEAGALRKAFPEELGGMITVDELDEMRDVTPEHKPSEKKNVAKLESPNIPGPARGSDDSAPKTLPANETIPPQGRQQKERIVRDAQFMGLKTETSNGKTWHVVHTLINVKGEMRDVFFTTFSESHFKQLSELAKGTPLRVRVTEGRKGYALESFEVINQDEELV